MDTAESQPGPQTEAGDGQPVLALRHATKSFGAVRALADGSVELRAGAAVVRRPGAALLLPAGDVREWEAAARRAGLA